MKSDQQLHNQQDGTSQAERRQAALDPDYVLVDERSLHDLLEFARLYASKLVYFGVEQNELKLDGNWDQFFPTDLAELITFIEHPERLSPKGIVRYSRPHLVLFITFLKLFQHVQTRLNTLTRQHLNYYYQQVLRMAKRSGVPDRVNVLVDLAAGVDQFLLPAGTMLDAGADSIGQIRHYRTTHDIVANRAKIGAIKSLYVDQQIIGLQSLRKSRQNNNETALLPMLELALGREHSGDSVPLVNQAESLNSAKLAAIKNIFNFLRHTLNLDGFTAGINSNYRDFNTLIRFKRQREDSAGEWAEINDILERTGKNIYGDDFEFPLETTTNLKDFEQNLKDVLGGNLKFGGLPEVEDIYDLYRIRTQEKARNWIADTLKFTYTDFDRMMQIKIKIDGEWDEIHRILHLAWQRAIPTADSADAPIIDPKIDDAFTELINEYYDAIGPVNYGEITNIDESEFGELGSFYDIVDLDSLATAVRALETSFFMPAEQIAYCLRVADKENPTEAEWTRVEQLLDQAHKDKVYSDRIAELRLIGGKPVDWERLLAYVVGGVTTGQIDNLDRVIEVLTEADAQFLQEISSRVNDDLLISPDEWERVYKLLALAWPILQNIQAPVPQIVNWLNLFPAEDATTQTVTIALDNEEETPRWRTFGRGVSDVQNMPPPTSLGWGIQSPLLALSGGVRIITLTLGFTSGEFDRERIEGLLFNKNGNTDGPFSVQLSSETGWIEVKNPVYHVGDYRELVSPDEIVEDEEKQPSAIKITISLDESILPILPLPDDPTAVYPTCRLMLKPLWDEANNRYQTHYTPFKDLQLVKTHLHVDVTGLPPTHLQNDNTILKPNKPFEPFGSIPLAGSRLFIGHSELTHSKLGSLSFQVEWMGLPDNGFSAQYKNYPGTFSDQTFQVKISLIDRRQELLLTGSERVQLFGQDKLEAGEMSDEVQRLLSPQMGDDLLSWDRFVQWELLSPDFQHAVYPALAAEKASKLSIAIATGSFEGDSEGNPDPSKYQVNPPYTPKVKRLTISYSAAVEIETAGYPSDPQFDYLYHIEPFGHREMTPYKATFMPNIDHEGVLYIGIKDAQPPQNLSILFQMAEGSADPDLKPVPIQWHYLSGNRWLTLEDGKLLGDSTRGLINSGIITVELRPTEPNTLLPSDLYWLRATISQQSRSVADTVALHTQAVSAVFVDQNNAADHLSQPLPPESITDLVRRKPAIKGIRQPYTSYGGKMAEADTYFYTRISERLRHKQRAMTLWDYEHLVLEHFPDIYKVKCLPAQPDQPGMVTVVVIPDIRHKRPFDPFAPKAPANLIADIHTFLTDLAPPSVKVNVKNAVFVPVKTRFGVRLHEGYSEGFYFNQLNGELRRFLSPWAYEDTPDIEIGGRIYANVIVNFIEERPYVDYVAKIKLFTDENGQVVQTDGNDAYVEAMRPDGVLVSDLQHEIDLITEAGYEEENFTGINYMKIELDFIVG